MLDPWIIEQIRKREETDRWEERPMLEVDDRPPIDHDDDRAVIEDEIERGVVILDFGI